MDLSLVSEAFAQAEGATPPGPSMFELLALPLGFLMIMYFFIIRPQQKRAKEHAGLLTNLKSGDEVYTTGGIIGRVKSVADSFVTLEVSTNTAVKILKSNITGLTKSAEPAKAKK